MLQNFCYDIEVMSIYRWHQMAPLDHAQIVTAIILSKVMVWSFSVFNHGLQHGQTLPNTQFLSLYFCNFLSGGQTLMHWPQRCCSGKGAERPVFLSMEVWNSGCGQCLFSYSYFSPSFFSLSTVPISCGLLCRTVIFLWWNTVFVCSIYCIKGENI